MRRLASEEATVSAMVAVLAVAMIGCAGLVYDGGAIITATAAARDLASGAARAGAQQVSSAAVHAGTADVDPVAAIAAAEAFLDAAEVDGFVAVTGPTVTVTVRMSQPMRFLPLPDRQIAASASATATSDVLGGP